MNGGFAVLCLTTWLRRHGGSIHEGRLYMRGGEPVKTGAPRGGGAAVRLERETGFEPATSTLARLHSTTELLPPNVILPVVGRREGICHAAPGSSRVLLWLLKSLSLHRRPPLPCSPAEGKQALDFRPPLPLGQADGTSELVPDHHRLQSRLENCPSGGGPLQWPRPFHRLDNRAPLAQRVEGAFRSMGDALELTAFDFRLRQEEDRTARKGG